MANTKKLTPKQEDFCHSFLELKSASAAYRACYDAENCKTTTVHRKAKELIDNGKIAARLDELRAQANEYTEITMGEVAGDLRYSYKVAKEQANSGHMTLAANSLAKLGALIVDQQRVENVDVNEAHLDALRELAAAPAPEPAPEPVVPPAEAAHMLDPTPESDDAVRH